MIHFSYKPKGFKQTIPWQLAKNQTMILMPLGDIHFGAKGFPEEHLKENIEWALDRGISFIGMGEYCDMGSASQRQLLGQLRDESRAELDVMMKEKIDQLFEILKPTKGHWIGLLEGDHRFDLTTGTSIDQYLCELLVCPFLGTSALIRIRADVKNHPEADTLLYCHHGIGSSRSAGGHLIQVENLLKVFDADVYLMGHSHSKTGSPIDRQYLSPDNVHHHRTKILARTGAWIRSYMSSAPHDLGEPVILSRGSYIEQKAYTPASLGGIIIGIGFEQIHGSRFFRPALHLSL